MVPSRGAARGLGLRPPPQAVAAGPAERAGREQPGSGHAVGPAPALHTSPVPPRALPAWECTSKRAPLSHVNLELLNSVNVHSGEAESPTPGRWLGHPACPPGCPGHPVPPGSPCGEPSATSACWGNPSSHTEPRGPAAAPGTGVLGVWSGCSPRDWGAGGLPAGTVPWCLLLLVPRKGEITK